MEHYKYCIIGGGAAGVNAAAQLRKLDTEGSVIVVEKSRFSGVSKCFLPAFVAGEIDDFSKLIGFSEEYAARHNIILENNSYPVSYKSFPKTVFLSSGRTFTFDKCIVATGSRAFIIPPLAKKISNHFSVTPEDLLRLRDRLDSSAVSRVLVVGSGLNSVKIAEALIKRGVSVTIVSNSELLPSFGDLIRNAVRDVLSEHNCLLTEHSGILDSEVSAGTCRSVETPVGRLACDIVISATGSIPDIEFAGMAGLDTEQKRYIHVNDSQQASVFGFFAAGECCLMKNMNGKKEVFPTATASSLQARIAAFNAAGIPVKRNPVVENTIFSFLSGFYGYAGIKEYEATECPYTDILFHPLPGLVSKNEQARIRGFFNESKILKRVEITANYNIHGLLCQFLQAIESQKTASELAFSYNPYSSHTTSVNSALQLIALKYLSV